MGLIGLALLHGESLPAMRLSHALRKLILGHTLGIEDMATVDRDFYNGKILYLLEERYKTGPAPLAVQDLGLTFEDAPQPDVFPELKCELCPGGASKTVTEENKRQYVELLCHSRLRASVRPQLDALLSGFRALVPEQVHLGIQRIVSPVEFGLLLCGLQKLDVSAWRAHSVQSEGTSAETWARFWAIVE